MPDPSASPATVLLVEDEPLVRVLVSELLGEEGFRVLEASNAAEALTILEAGLPVSVLLADVEMPPGIDGYELARRVHARWPQIETLLTSGRRWPAEGDLPAGAAFIAKPCPNEALVLQVKSAIDRHQAVQRARRADDAIGEGEAQILPFPKTG